MIKTDDIVVPLKSHAQTWGIQEFSSLFDTTPRALRFYEDKGLLTPSRQAGARVFSANEYTRMERITRAKRMGFTLEDIKTVLDVTDGLVTDRTELKSRRDNFEKVIKSLHRRRKDIDVLTTEMTGLCSMIDDFVDSTPEDTGISQYVKAYDAALREHMDDEFGFDDTGSQIRHPLPLTTKISKG